MTEPNPDWPEIEQEYRAGIESVRSIAAKYGIDESRVRQKAKANGWQRDVSGDVRRRVKRALLVDQAGLRTEPPRGDPPQNGSAETAESPELDEAIIDGVTKTSVEVSRRHRTGLGKLRLAAEKLIDMLETYMGEIEAEPVADDPQKALKDRRAGLLLGERDTAVTVTSKLGGVLARLIPLERMVYGITEAQSGQDAAKEVPRKPVTPAEMMAAARAGIAAAEPYDKPAGDPGAIGAKGNGKGLIRITSQENPQ